MQTSGDLLDQPCPPDEYSLYIHIPFCQRKCPYCHFFVLENDQNLHANFVSAIIKEWHHYQPAFLGLKLRSIYFGGGTPSLLPAELIGHLIQVFTAKASLSEIEITLEANPESISENSLLQYHKVGVNRISLGIQSLVDKELLALGRGHRSPKALEAAKCISKGSFKSYSFDLMMETPHQTLSSWQYTLDNLQKAPPPHLSLYNLVIEPHTPFAKAQKRLKKLILDPQSAVQMLHYTCDLLPKIGLERYEISAFAKKGHHSIHNTGYWRGRTFIGLGPSAFSYYKGERFQNVCSWQLWLDAVNQGKAPIGFREKLSEVARQAELLAIHLRLCCGVDLAAFQDRWGKLASSIMHSLDLLQAQGLIENTRSQTTLSAKGQLYYERVASEIVIID